MPSVRPTSFIASAASGQGWDLKFLAYYQQLQSKKPLIAYGDLNVAHREIDFARPKSNYNKSASYTQVKMTASFVFDARLVDTFQHFLPDTAAYGWWSFRAAARAKNDGWRIDYITCRPEKPWSTK